MITLITDFPENVTLIEDVDCTQEDCAGKTIAGLNGNKVDTVIYVSGVVQPEVRCRESRSSVSG